MTHAASRRPIWQFFMVSAIITLLVAGVVTWSDGPIGLWLFFILLILEITFSFDNAIINSRTVVKLSPFWQKIFLSIGIIIAVFVVRFLLPIFIVKLASGLSVGTVFHLALFDPTAYTRSLHHAAPMINAFGGTFLLMIGLNYFLDRGKTIQWIKPLESWMAAAGRYESIKVFILLLAEVILFLTISETYRTTVMIASALGILLNIGLNLLTSFLESHQKRSLLGNKPQTGWLAFTSFLYLEVLDASFSLDGVIGAFAITTSVVLIIAGLGAGALWVRSFTLYIVKTGVLDKFKYIEHGAHWAILALGVVMIAKLYGAAPPEWLVGSLGLVFIAVATGTSVLEKRRENSEKRQRSS